MERNFHLGEPEKARNELERVFNIRLSSSCWMNREPIRGWAEASTMAENTNAFLKVDDDFVVWDEDLLTDSGISFQIAIVTDPSYPRTAPKVFIDSNAPIPAVPRNRVNPDGSYNFRLNRDTREIILNLRDRVFFFLNSNGVVYDDHGSDW